uniref:MULE transposase domain-containing protein n=1 Tax=Nicotiana tabacum TaxID=4097 RepID=A0A1S3Z442_TOBAC|nr:PREDICTED: uncharacterized protein LOC107782581 [Nicotiana tabacum]
MDMICYNSNSVVISSECAQSSVVEERYNDDTIKMIEFGDGEDWNDTESDKNTIITDPQHIDVEEGLQCCKPVVVVDGTFLKSAYRGTLLIASTQDPAGNILPLAYAIVDSENNASWEWFFARFKDAFGEREGMCIVSDRHEGIENVAPTLYPQVPHSKAYTVEKFDYHMEEVEKIDKRVKDYLMNIGYERWSIAYSSVNRTLTMTSNIAESINAALKAAKELPVLPLLDYIRKLIRRWNVTNLKNTTESVTDLGKKYNTMLMDNLELSHQMKLDELPCAHAWAILKYKYTDHTEYCSVYYTTKYLLKTYEIPIYPVPDESIWELPAEVLNEKVLPPDMTKK